MFKKNKKDLFESDPIYKNIWESIKNNLTVQLLLFVLIGILILFLAYALKNDDFQKMFYFIEDKNIFILLSNGSLTLGTIIISSAVIDFLHSTNAFSKIMLKEFNKALVDKKFIEKYSDKEIDELVQKIQDSHSHIKIENLKISEESIVLAKEATQRLINEAKTSKEESEEVLRRASQNYYIKKSNHTRTIMRNGSEISTYEFEIEIIENGVFAFFYKFSSSNESVELPAFKDFLNNVNERFSKNSFCADIIEYRRNGFLRNCHNCLNIEAIQDEKIDKEIILAITDCYKGDSFRLSFSLTVENEINSESIQKQKDDLVKGFLSLEVDKSSPSKEKEGYTEMKQKKIHGAVSRNPIGVRKIKVQQERYGYNAQGMELSPSIKVGELQVMPINESKSIYYDTVEWIIYYKEHSDGKVIFSLL